jgi:hypothetical protein
MERRRVCFPKGDRLMTPDLLYHFGKLDELDSLSGIGPVNSPGSPGGNPGDRG